MASSMYQPKVYVVHTHQLRRIFYSVSSDLHRIWLLRFAKGSIKIDDKEFKIHNHMVVFAYPGQIIEVSSIGPFEGYCVAFNESFFYQHTEHKEMLFKAPFFGYMMALPIAGITSKQFTMFGELLKQMVKEYKLQSMWYEQILLSMLNVFLLRIKRFKWAQNSQVHRSDYTTLHLVMMFKQLIRLNCHKEHSVSWYAKQLQQSPNYLNLMVKQVTGHPAGNLIATQLIIEAKRQLIHSKLSAKEIAFALGFYDHSYFTKFFKKHTGNSPLEWFNKNK
ncbi:MAG TPA: helix-turn-helix domain-containing protein [Chitinophagales bacterium]|nr:helix-turn-helix domain-containing protein [Chitinophagales bacterium]HRG29235.1 helix-turn-helix domain-containing protein [Chitinophagales bacterium]HRH53640.1 helix-turn-helix domain-containing protein [Chitinophagales bacterium]